MSIKTPSKFINREISWLSFNERVLQEAEDIDNPIIERMKFLGIYSNNRDEFFRVRVANIKRVADLPGHNLLSTGEDPKEVIDKILKQVFKQQTKFDKLYKDLIKELHKEHIYFLNESQIGDEHKEFVKRFFMDKVRTNIVPIVLNKKKGFPFLKDASTYMFVKMYNKTKIKENAEYAIIEIPTGQVDRILTLPSIDKKKYLIMIDDIIRYNLPQVFSIFNYDTIEAYNVKLTRDAGLEIDDDISKSIVDKLSKGVKNRQVGEPVR